MLDYEEIKNWFGDKDNQKKLAVGIGFFVVFLVGFGSGRYERVSARSKLQTNYSSFSQKKPDLPPSKEADVAPAAGEGTKAGTSASPASSSCIVKGNISAAGKKIYHVQGGAFYKTVKPEQCFATEAEAQAAGFVKSQR